MKGTIVYLHGFASVGTSSKSQALKDVFGESNVFSPDLPFDPDNVIDVVDSIVSKVTNYPLIFVGTSLGGFWANYFTQKYDAIGVLVNPSTRPDVTMADRVGTTVANYKTGAAIDITEEHIEKLSKYKAEAQSLQNGNLIHLFLAMDDEVLDFKVALKDFKYFKTSTISTSGGHRYDSKWSLVVDQLKKLTA